MPHLSIETNIELSSQEKAALVASLHKTMLRCPFFSAPEIKSRYVETSAWETGEENRAIIFVIIRLMEGRTSTQLSDLAREISATTIEYLYENKKSKTELCIEFIQLNKSTYFKYTD